MEPGAAVQPDRDTGPFRQGKTGVAIGQKSVAGRSRI